MEAATEWALWVTDRCAREDLRLGSWPGPDGVYGEDDEIVQRFRERRSQQPDGPEHIQQVRGRHCTSLHAARCRGCTWYDQQEGLVWLLAVGWHEEGHHDDAYNYFEQLERRGELYPSNRDRRAFRIWLAERWLRQLRDTDGPELIAEAVACPESVVGRDWSAPPTIFRVGDDDEDEGEAGKPPEPRPYRVRLVVHPVEGDWWIGSLLLETEPRWDPRQIAAIARALTHRWALEPLAVAPTWEGEWASPPHSYAFDFWLDPTGPPA